MKRRLLARRSSGLWAVTCLVLAMYSPSPGQTPATWNGLGGNTSYNDPDNWDIAVVPVNDGTTYSVTIPGGVTVLFDVDGPRQITDLSLGAGSTLSISPGKSLTVLDDALIYGFLTAENSTFLAQSAAAQFPGNAARLRVAGGGLIAVAGTSYSSTGLNTPSTTYTLFSAQGAGSTLDLSSLQSLNAGFTDGGGWITVHRIEAVNGGQIDLSGLQTLQGAARSEDRLEVVVNTGGAIDLSALESITAGYTRFDLALAPADPFALPALESAVNTTFALASGTTLNLPSLLTHNGGAYNVADGSTVSAPALTSANGVTLTVDSGGTFAAPNLTTFTGGVFNRQPGQVLTLPAFTSMDNSRLSVSGGESLAVAATSYSSTGLNTPSTTYTLFSSQGAGSLLDLGSIQSLNAGFTDGGGWITVHRIEAVNAGQIDLSGVRSIVGPLRAEDRLEVIVSNGGTLLLGFTHITRNVQVSVTDSPSALEVAGHLSLADTTRIDVTGAARIELAGSFSFHHTDESDFDLDAAVLDFVGGGLRFLEVAGEDVGLPAGGLSGNFGAGQLVLGWDGQATTVQLLDAVNNLNRAGGPEALYLFGLGGPDGLRILNNSTLAIANLNVYAVVGGEWVHINDLFEPGETIIPYDGGFISKTGEPVIPGDATLDWAVDGADYTLWADNYTLPGDWPEGDFNRDGWVDGADYTIWADHYAPGAIGTSVPEPASLALLALGASVLLRRRRA